MNKSSSTEFQILIAGAAMLKVKVKDPADFLKLLTESMYQRFLIAGETNKEEFDGNKTRTFELKVFIDDVARRLFYDDNKVSAYAIAEGLKQFMVMGGIDSFDGMMQDIILALAKNTQESEYTDTGMDEIIPSLGILCELREYLRQYDKAKELNNESALIKN